jgi:hypothetical protein
MYSLNLPVSAIRTKIRQEFERHRFVNQLPVVDMLLFKSHAEYQVRQQKGGGYFLLPLLLPWRREGGQDGNLAMAVGIMECC